MAYLATGIRSYTGGLNTCSPTERVGQRQAAKTATKHNIMNNSAYNQRISVIFTAYWLPTREMNY